MKNFTYTLGEQCAVGNEAIHAAGPIHLDGEHVASVVQVIMLNGKIYWRIFDYNE